MIVCSRPQTVVLQLTGRRTDGSAPLGSPKHCLFADEGIEYMLRRTHSQNARCSQSGEAGH
ncbi:MAG: hypothetical protein AVDCRST_MAG43-1477 [uncultured Thermomicrobiales bacterium]|uniref:Uncharacterized protein n=1 Tax=uncultured Thermomicrobiales bacterium TaxID=1645740 RepID=A0A6J4UNU9_9BACT|nr:MAG: hypothetical protein AVDCRST_MAG43-1477 [uncultured Thermomicrobiales bacterium]